MRYFLIFLGISFCISCSKNNLEIEPTDRLSDAIVFSDPATANLFLNDMYNSLNAGPYPTVFTNVASEVSNEPLDNFTDNTTYGPGAGLPSMQLFDAGSYGAANTLFDNQWKNMYTNIRKCNLFIEKITPSDFDEATKKQMIAEARFLRAYFYKQLNDLYFGVPIITKTLNNETQGDEIFYARNTYEECVEFLQTELQAAADDLPVSYTGKDIGRATRGAALGLKGEEELYAGKWQDAVNTNKLIMDENNYSLFPDYAGLFYTNNENNEEVLFDIQFASVLKPKGINQYQGVVDVPKGGGWGSGDPTQNIVDEYEFTDGKTEAEGSAMFNPDNPYTNREKRFYASVIYDGSTWKGKVVYTRLGIPNNSNEINLTGKSGNCGRTGYFVKKTQDSTLPNNNVTLDGNNYIVLRYAEILLNYAEAQNELNGPDQSVYDAVNLIRVRAGQPQLPAALSKDDMRKRIRHERRIELAFEGKYFYDIIRWKTATEIFNNPVYGMKITEQNGKLVYEKVPVRNIKFDAAKNYKQPIPQYALDQNTKLVQNPGY